MQRLLPASITCAVLAVGCAADAPSILLVTIDTLRPDHLSHNGYARQTSPVLDAVAASGLVFDIARSNAPLTAPAHASILTGRLPAWHQVLTNGDVLDDGVVTVAERLRDAGFRTAAFVGNATITSIVNFQQGFEHFDDSLPQLEANRPQPERGAVDTVDAALAWLGSHHDKRFFCWLHLQDPHGPYEPPAAAAAAFVDEARVKPPVLLPLLSDQSGHGGIPQYQAFEGERNAHLYRARYDGEIRHTDAELGRALGQLRIWGVDPFLVVTADHGEAMGEHDFYFAHGHGLTEDQVRVPLLLRGPGVPTGVRSAVPVEHRDIVPTILRRAGLRVPADLPGRDLLAVGDGRNASIAQAFRDGWAVTRDGEKLIVWPRRRSLHDLGRDPGEEHDIAAVSPDTVARLEDILAAVRSAPAPPWQRRSAQPELLRQQLRALGYLE